MNRHLVQAVTRRKAFLIDPAGARHEAALRSSSDDLVCGDFVAVDRHGGAAVISERFERKNLLSRAYRERSKLLAANLDILFIVSAVSPLFNTVVIDRIIAACTYENIPFALIVNKRDLGIEETAHFIEIYRALGFDVLPTCAKADDGITGLEKYIDDRKAEILAFCGMSGVGKSSLINRLIPGAIGRTSDVSRKTGQGKQTTALAQAYMRIAGDRPQYVIDLPGVQNFGISHIPLEQLRFCFQEFVEAGARCQFPDCSHTTEPSCAVVSGVDDGTISRSRYDSYLNMRGEVIRGKPY